MIFFFVFNDGKLPPLNLKYNFQSLW